MTERMETVLFGRKKKEFYRTSNKNGKKNTLEVIHRSKTKENKKEKKTSMVRFSKFKQNS